VQKGVWLVERQRLRMDKRLLAQILSPRKKPAQQSLQLSAKNSRGLPMNPSPPPKFVAATCRLHRLKH
jgi:hypothetical protein